MWNRADCWKHLRRRCGYALAAQLLVAQPGAAGEPRFVPGVSNVRVPDAATNAAVRHALLRIRRRLSQPGCLAILSEFKDGSGRSLQGALDESGRTFVDHLDGLFFYDGSKGPACHDSDVLAVTMAGSHVVFICTAQFRSAELRSHQETEALLIHEVLHTLGLGENPPTSREITRRVTERCFSTARAAVRRP